jgi:hypothetical protein
MIGLRLTVFIVLSVVGLMQQRAQAQDEQTYADKAAPLAGRRDTAIPESIGRTPHISP